MDQAIGNLKKMAVPGSLVFVVSDFRHLSSLAKDLFIQISKHCDLCLCFIYDPLEADFPKYGQCPVTDGNRDQNLNSRNLKDLENYRKQFIERRNSVSSLANQRHIHFMECSTEDECLKLLKNVF